MEKAWEGRFREPTEEFVEEFTQSVSFDKRLALYDIQQSLAHVETLQKAGILSQQEAESIKGALLKVKEKITKGEFSFRRELEDVHMNIEKALIEELGPMGGKVHTGRSRNDQVVTDLRLYLKEEINHILDLLSGLRRRLVRLAEETLEVVAPSYTHLQRAQPIRLAHYFLAYREAFLEDTDRFVNAFRRVDALALGSGAVAGVDFPLDRFFTAQKLGFRSVLRNSMHATGDRGFLLDVLYSCAVCGMHLSRLSEDLILWSSEEFGFVELPDRLCTGSSIMPQKKNPDVLELIRGKAGRLYGNLLSLLTVLKGLPMAYNRDLQEDKEPLFDSLDTLKGCLKGASLVLEGLKVREDKLRAAAGGFTLATDLANYLVGKGVPFREAHRIVGSLVAKLVEEGRSLQDVTLEDLRTFSPLFQEDVLKLLDPLVVADRRQTYGGTSKERVKEQIELAKREEGL
ncbi:argininosuccinate lyase [Thermocrinis albus DSM 14484]|uniref:Argininosuccinate lyase n=1 Tax=Thermocrinis albus (strain DSM 14484 / JCM 11386 / HI 11/12) TaxID=638303 RepID=D3SND2_THEAH|nr:argininosuccinate lyase [Thermocrinis albus]ADC88669.1 argininosuccinate lyase [Thermocrinis albus DSM 14484]